MMRLVAGLATLLSILCFSTGVSAHASLVSVEPGDGSVLAQAPNAVRLRFNEAVTPADIRLIDAAGRVRDDATVNGHGDTIEIGLPHGLPRGTQIVSYRVFSADGHPVGGSVAFSIGSPSAKALPPTDATPAIAPLIWLSRIGVYLGLFAGIGGAFFCAWIARAGEGEGVIAAALAIGLFSAAASLGLQGLDLRNLPLGDIVTTAPWQAATATSLFPSLLIAIVAMMTGLAAQRSKSAGIAVMLSAIAIAGVGLSLAASGHASTAPPSWLTRPMVFLHGVGVAFWVGALVPLVAMAWKAEQGLLAVLHRFSRAAVVVVGLLVLTGLGLAIIQLGSFRAMVETRYGLILSIKLTLVMLLLGLAAFNRFRLTPALAADPGNARPLLRSMLAECVVAVAIFALVAGWRFTPPPRALVAATRAPLAFHVHTDAAMLKVTVSPAADGAGSFVLQLTNGDATPFPAKEVVLALSLPERGIEPLERKAVPGAEGYWYVRDVPIPFSGRWHLRVEALVSDFRKVTLEDDFEEPAR
jgi:copper transport protein